MADNRSSSPILNYFAYKHLSHPELRQVGETYSKMAHTLDVLLPNGPEKTVAFRKLLESKDCAVRMMLDTLPPTTRNTRNRTLFDHDLMVDTLVYHHRSGAHTCSCGVDVPLGRNYYDHVIDVYEKRFDARG